MTVVVCIVPCGWTYGSYCGGGSCCGGSCCGGSCCGGGCSSYARSGVLSEASCSRTGAPPARDKRGFQCTCACVYSMCIRQFCCPDMKGRTWSRRDGCHSFHNAPFSDSNARLGDDGQCSVFCGKFSSHFGNMWEEEKFCNCFRMTNQVKFLPLQSWSGCAVRTTGCTPSMSRAWYMAVSSNSTTRLPVGCSTENGT
jgi:hypothetical protein